MNDAAIQAIVNYSETYLCQPELDWPEHWFEEITFSRWAVGEILNDLMDHPTIPADECLERFAIKMDIYSRQSEGTQGRIFSIAAQTARELLDLI